MAARSPALVAVGVSMVSVQTGPSLAKGLFPPVGAQGATALRVSVAAVILLLLLRPWRNLPTRRAWTQISCHPGGPEGLPE